MTYYPILSGRLYHLLALKRLVNNNLLSQHIVPIIAPVKISDSLLRTLDCFITQQHHIAVMLDSTKYSSLDYEEQRRWEKYLDTLQSPYIQKVIDFHENLTSLEAIDSFAQQYACSHKRLAYFLSNKVSFLTFQLLFGYDTEALTFIPAEFKPLKNSVLIQDPTTTLIGNTLDGAKLTMSSVTQKENIADFSDYLWIGKRSAIFLNSEFVIPLAYCSEVQKRLRVHYFAETIYDSHRSARTLFLNVTAKIFSQNSPIVTQTHAYNQTQALTKLYKLYQDKCYPGLGHIRKLAIQHYLECMGHFLIKISINKNIGVP